MYDVVSVGSATEDVFVKVHPKAVGKNVCFVPGTKMEIDDMDYFIGGGATNSAVAFARLGLKTGILAAIGDDESGRAVLREMREEKVGTKLIIRSKKLNTPYSVILTGFGKDRVILVYRGATAELNNEKEIDWKELKKAEWLHLGSIHTKPIVLKRLVRFALMNGIKVAFNPGGRELKTGLKAMRGLLRGTDVLFMNKEEAELLTKKKNLRENLKILQRYSPIAVITDGRKGAYAYDGGNLYFKNIYDTPHIDSTGAGDAFNSGFTAALIAGKDIPTALDWGTAEASSIVCCLGTKNILLTKSGLKKFIKKYSRKNNRVRVSKL